MQRDTMWTGISSFDSLNHDLGLTWFHLPSLAEGVSGDSSVLFLDCRNARDMGKIAEHFRALAYVVRAVRIRCKSLVQNEAK